MLLTTYPRISLNIVRTSLSIHCKETTIPQTVLNSRVVRQISSSPLHKIPPLTLQTGLRTVLSRPSRTTIPGAYKPSNRSFSGSNTCLSDIPSPTSNKGQPLHNAPNDRLQAVNTMAAPYAPQDTQEVASLVRLLQDHAKNKKGFSVKKTNFDVSESPTGLTVDSWRFHDFDYKKHDLPTYARGLFTTRTRHNVPEIAIRGYDKFFNTTEVAETKWKNIERQTTGPYELTLKENGCIIFISGLEDGTLLVCSKHSTGDRQDGVSHASAGLHHVERQLEALGKTKEDLARVLREANITAVAELCDDTFEEHILAYGPDKAGLYLHGINVNLPRFMTYPSTLVHEFADKWGFRKVGLLTMDTIGEVRTFLDGCAESGAYDGRDVEGFVIRCKRSADPAKLPYEDWFFKFKFEEPYLLYRQWREATKQLIAGKPPKFKKHRAITEEYLMFAKKRLASDRNLGKLYNQNHGIIALRDEFLAFKKINGADAAKFEEMFPGGSKTQVDRDVILVPIATIGCGKTTIAVALSKLFNFGHVQNDNIQGKGRPPRFTKAVLEQLEEHKAVTADRNNAAKHERKQILTDVRMQHSDARLVALNFVHDNMDKVREITGDRVFARGDNHQTIQAATDPKKVEGIMEGFRQRFEPVNGFVAPDDGFDEIINLDPTQDSRTNLETAINELKKLYPNLIEHMPSPEDMDRAIQEALGEYRPDLRHTIPDRGHQRKENRNQQQQPPQAPKAMKKKPLEYMSVDVPAKTINELLEKTFKDAGPEKSRFYKTLQGSRRVQPKFHVTLMHRASAKENPNLWNKYISLHDKAEAKVASTDGKLGECEVVLERVVFDDRVMAIVARLNDSEWECVNKVPHITVGTRADNIKPKESNDLLARWLSEGGNEENKIEDIAFEVRPAVKCAVKSVLSR